MAALLNELTKESKTKGDRFDWSESCEEAFQSLKTTLIQTTVPYSKCRTRVDRSSWKQMPLNSPQELPYYNRIWNRGVEASGPLQAQVENSGKKLCCERTRAMGDSGSSERMEMLCGRTSSYYPNCSKVTYVRRPKEKKDIPKIV